MIKPKIGETYILRNGAKATAIRQVPIHAEVRNLDRLHRLDTSEPPLFDSPSQGALRREAPDLYARVIFLRKQHVPVYRCGRRQHHVGNRLLSTWQLFLFAERRGFE